MVCMCFQNQSYSACLLPWCVLNVLARLKDACHPVISLTGNAEGFMCSPVAFMSDTLDDKHGDTRGHYPGRKWCLLCLW